MNQLCVQAG